METIDKTFPFLFAIAIAFFIIVVAHKLNVLENSNWWKYLNSNVFFRIFLTVGVISIILIFSLKSYVGKLSRKEIKETIELLAKKEYTLVIDNEVAVNDSLIVALQNIRSASNSRNSRTRGITVQITDGTISRELILVRDFYYKTKYWVFYNNYENTSGDCIGEINTSSLDTYK